MTRLTPVMKVFVHAFKLHYKHNFYEPLLPQLFINKTNLCSSLTVLIQLAMLQIQTHLLLYLCNEYWEDTKIEREEKNSQSPSSQKAESTDHCRQAEISQPMLQILFMGSQLGSKIQTLKGDRENPVNNDIARIFCPAIAHWIQLLMFQWCSPPQHGPSLMQGYISDMHCQW